MRTSDVVADLWVRAHAPNPRLQFLSDRWPQPAMVTTDSSIRVVRSELELEDVGRLRNDVRAARAGQPHAGGEVGDRTVVDEIDRCSLVFVAEHQGRELATVRLSRAIDALGDSHLAPLIEAVQPADLAVTVVVSRFAVIPERQARALALPMFFQAYRSMHLVGARCALMTIHATMVQVFAQFGWKPTGEVVHDPFAGEMQILRHDLLDMTLLRAADSPLASIASDFFRHEGRAATPR
ncbi:N-acyl amino acid synthase FeeM domain-containing protein [Rhodopseudomonas sp.]|uniref:N-acyl amino acid synthase FeeM domain-containing protein n=1 Tax=Rhodopseudomonas sp. TaxID=1078 RepID=UPI0039E2F6C2